MDINDKISELEKYLEISSDELQEALELAIALYRYNYLLEDSLKKNLEEMIEWHHQWYKETYDIVKTVRTQEYVTYELEEKD